MVCARRGGPICYSEKGLVRKARAVKEEFIGRQNSRQSLENGEDLDNEIRRSEDILEALQAQYAWM